MAEDWWPLAWRDNPKTESGLAQAYLALPHGDHYKIVFDDIWNNGRTTPFHIYINTGRIDGQNIWTYSRSCEGLLELRCLLLEWAERHARIP